MPTTTDELRAVPGPQEPAVVTAEGALRALVRTALRDAALSQAEVARRLDVSPKHLCQMLTGRATLTLAWAERILALTGHLLTVDAAPLPKEEPMPAPEDEVAAAAVTWRRTHPDDEIARAVADWLDVCADYMAKWPGDAQLNSPFKRGGYAVARLINRGAAATDTACSRAGALAQHDTGRGSPCACGRQPDPGVCDEKCGSGMTPGGHCRCACADTNPPPVTTGTPAHDAVYMYIRSLGDHMPADAAHRNALIWRAVQIVVETIQATYTPPPPGSDRDALPEHLRVLIAPYMRPYLSTPCETAAACRLAAQAHPEHADELRQWEAREHAFCRLTRKQDMAACGCNCHTTKG